MMHQDWTNRSTVVTRGVRQVLCRRLTMAMAVIGLLCASFLSASPAFALKAITVGPDQDRIEITNAGEFYDNRGDSLQVETAAGLDGVVGRMSVKATTPGSNPSWIVFALTNPTNSEMERWLTADRYTVVGSGTIWPDLDARRIEAVTPSIGFVPERVDSDRADVFRITLEPGQTITFVAELSSERFSRIFLWKPFAYELEVRERQLFNGALLGLTGLLAIFLTAIFAANHKVIFPSAALVAWCVLVYLCVDFGFFHKLFNLRPEDNAVYRAAGEASIAASLVVFLHTFLRLGLSHGLVRMLFGVWILAQLALVAVAVVDPRLASTFARLSFSALGLVGALLILFLAFRGQDRALSIIPTWIIFLVWIFGTAVTLSGRMSGDVIEAGLAAGLVLIVIMIGFTVTQFAFRSLEPVYGASPSQQQRQALAVEGAGAATWEWNARRDEVKVSPVVEAALGLNGGELTCKVDDFLPHLHTADRERFRLMLWSVQERAGGKIRIDFRLRHSDNSYRWYELDAASVDTADRRDVRCLGLMRDITESKRAQERLLHNAVHCGLTNLPQRELFLDRLGTACLRAQTEPAIRPTVICIDLDKFKSVNTTLGLVVGDSLLLTVARRLSRHLGPQDTLSRIGGDQFAILLLAEQSARDLASLAERIRRSLRSPIKIAGKEIVLTGSLGISVYDGEENDPADILKEAEIAMYRAKRTGADRIEIFRPEMRLGRDDPATLENDLRKAIEKDQIKVLFQPIVYLPTEDLAGFEAVVRWEHPREGVLSAARLMPLLGHSDLAIKLSTHVLSKAAKTASGWQKILPRQDSPVFVSVNISCRNLFKQEFVQELRHVIGQGMVPVNCLRFEVREPLVMENPEQATEMLDILRGTGVEISLDEFGTGYSSLAYLQRLPVDTIKIDRGLMQRSGAGEGKDSSIVRSIVALSHELGKKVVAEGIEEPDDVVFLRSIGCEYGQGFYYGDPMPADEVVELLNIIAKSERKIEARSLFKPMTKSRKERKKASVSAEMDEKAAIAAPSPLPASVAANGQAGSPSEAKPEEEGSAPREVPAPSEAIPAPAKSRRKSRPPQPVQAGMLPPISEASQQTAASRPMPPAAPKPPASAPAFSQVPANPQHGQRPVPSSLPAPHAGGASKPLPVSGGRPAPLAPPRHDPRTGPPRISGGAATSAPPRAPQHPPGYPAHPQGAAPGFSNGRSMPPGATGGPLPHVSPAPPGGPQRGSSPTQPHPPVNARHADGGAVSPPSPRAAGNGHARPAETTRMPATPHLPPELASGGPHPGAGRPSVPAASAPVPPAPRGDQPLQQPTPEPPDYSSLPPGIAESLARLAGGPRSTSAGRGAASGSARKSSPVAALPGGKPEGR